MNRPSVSSPRSYVIVLDRSPEAQGFESVAEALAEFRSAEAILELGDEADGLRSVFAELRTRIPRPAYVAFVVAPHRIEDSFVGRVFEEATRFNAGAQVDIAYGFITGATPDDALKLVHNTRRAEEDREGINRKFAAIGHTFRENDLGMFALQQQAYLKAYGYESRAINPVDECAEWSARAPEEIRKLDGASLVYIAGHGAGDWLCGIDAEAFDGFTFDRAIIVNGACHSASMLLRHDLSGPDMTLVATSIAPERSICLRFIRAGAIAQFGSTASSAWMNVAFAIPEFFHNGQTLGEAMRRCININLGREGVEQFTILDFEVGQPSPQFLGPDLNPGHVQSISRVVLIGDPAYRPFPELRDMREIPVLPQRPHPMGPPPPPWQGAGVLPPEGASLDELIDALNRDINDHFVTLNLVINIGAPAVEPLIEKLRTTRSWQVPKALGAIRDPRAVDPLIEALERFPITPFSDVVVEALEAITGAKAGSTAQQWRTWREMPSP